MEPKQSGTDGTRQTKQSSSWLFPALLAIVLSLLWGMALWMPKPAPNTQPGAVAGMATAWTPAPQPTGQTASLVIDFGNGATREFAALPWQPEMTVADLMAAAREFQPGIVYTQISTGESGFLSSLEGLANEGAGGRNWLYRVDDRHAHVSFCLEKIEPGAHVLWTFGAEQYNEPEDKP